MARDYAKYKAHKGRAATGKPTYQRWLLLSVFILAVGVAIAGYVGKTNPALLKQAWLWVNHKKSVNNEKTRELAMETPEPEVHFDFYTTLPNMQQMTASTSETPTQAVTTHVQPPVIKEPSIVAEASTEPAMTLTEATPKEAAPTAEHATNTTLDFGHYQSAAEANQMRLSLLLSGVDTIIVNGLEAGKPVYYLRQGPIANVALAKKRQQQLMSKGISCEVVAS